MDTQTMLSRSGRSDSGGKLTSRLDVPVSQDLEEAVIALAAVAGVPKSEYVRCILERAVYGDLCMLRRLARPLAPREWDQSPNNPGAQS